MNLQARGANGTNAFNGCSMPPAPSGRGANGKHGGNAGFATHGTSGGAIDATLIPQENGMFAVSGNLSGPGGSQNIMAVAEVGKGVIFDVGGGNGGAGGIGGDGGAGGRGRSGIDATKYSSGTDGGGGGDGGNGGSGSSGGDGGCGGRVTVRVLEKDMHLAMLIDSVNVAGGIGGAAGRHGLAGRGGQGGPGGSSHHWTTTSTRKDSNGVDYTVTDSHFNPGGCSGPRGRNGNTPCGQLFNGLNGAPGSFSLTVNYANGSIASYADIFDLYLVSFKLESATHGSLLFEPGDDLMLSNIRVGNRSKMHTPTLSTISYGLEPNCNLQTHNQLSGGIIRGSESVLVLGQITCTINIYGDNEAASAFGITTALQPFSFLADANRKFKMFSAPIPLKICYPVIFTEIRHFTSLVAGTSSKIIISLRNIGGQDLGIKSSSGRSVKICMNAVSDIRDKFSLEFCGRNQRLNRPFEIDITCLPKMATDSIEVEFIVDDDVPPYSSLELRCSLLIENVKNKNVTHCVQVVPIKYSVAVPYQKVSDSYVLLVTNDGISKEEFNQWNLLFSKMSMSVSFFDSSLNHNFSLANKNATSGTSLFDDFSNGLIIVLNNQHIKGFKSLDLLDKKEIVSMKNYQTNILVLDDAPYDVETFMMQIESFNSVMDLKIFEKENDLLKAIESNEDKPFILEKKFFFSDCQGKKIAKKGIALTSKLLKLFPNRRFKLVTSSPNESTGRILIVPTAQRNPSGRVVKCNSYDLTLRNSSFSQNSEILSTIAVCLPLNNRLALFHSDVNDIGKFLMSSFLFDISEEMICSFVSKITPKTGESLVKLSNIALSFIASSKSQESVVFLLANLYGMLSFFSSFWQRNFIMRKAHCLIKSEINKFKAMARESFQSKDFNKLLNQKKKEILSKIRSQFKESNSSSRKEFLLKHFLKEMGKLAIIDSSLTAGRLMRDTEFNDRMTFKGHHQREMANQLLKGQTDLMELCPIPPYIEEIEE